MKNYMLIFCFFLTSFGAAFAQESVTDGLDGNMQNPGYHAEPEWFKESFLDIREDIAEATEGGKRLMLYFHQDGCPYCEKLIQDNFGQKTIADFSQAHFDTISINIWGDREVIDFDGNTTTEKHFAKQLRVQFTPTILLLTENVQLALRINGYYAPHKFQAALQYVSEKRETKERFRDYFASLQPEIASGKMHNDKSYLQAPFDFKQSLTDNQKPLLVIFEQKQCNACDELHNDILKRKDLVLLQKSFDISVVDMWSKEHLTTPDGKTLALRDWANELGISHSPSMVFFDVQGQEVFRTEAYLKAFHTQVAINYVASGAYKTEPEFQRFVEAFADEQRENGQIVDLMN